MINNGKDIRKAMRDAKKEPSKGDPLKGVIYDPRGQYAFPGEITKIQGDAYGTPITMVGVPYPMLGVDDLGYSQMMYPNMEYQFAGQHVTEYPMPPKQYFNAYGGDPSLPAITGHYPFGGMYTKTHTHMQEGGWLDAYDDEYRRGGGVNPLMKARSKRSGTSKNIQSSINKIFLRNKDLFGPGGKNVYDPNSKYQEGGLRAASTTAAVPVSTKAPVNPVNPESTMGLIDFIKHRWNTRDQGPSDLDLGYVDPITGNYINTGVNPFDLMLPVQAASGAKAAASALVKKASTASKAKKTNNFANWSGKDFKSKIVEASKDVRNIPEEMTPYISHRVPDSKQWEEIYNRSKTLEDYRKGIADAVQYFDRQGNLIKGPEKRKGGQTNWLDNLD